MLFEEQLSRKPNRYPWTQEFINAMWAGHWTPNEFDFKSDYNQFKKEMPESDKRMIVKTLTAIGQIEIAVKRFWAQLGDNLPHPSMYDLGFEMAHIEVIHNQAYEKLIDVLRLSRAFEENLKEPVVGDRVAYLRKYLKKVYTKDERKQYIYALILFTLFIENVSLFSQFYIILWYNRNRNMLKDTAQQVQYTRNEELIHALAGIKIINTLRTEYSELFDTELEQRIYEECAIAYDAESNMIDWMLDGFSDEGLSPQILKNYVADRINSSLSQIGYAPKLEVNPTLLAECKWMDEELYGYNMVDFFHKKPVDYSKSNKVYTEEALF